MRWTPATTHPPLIRFLLILQQPAEAWFTTSELVETDWFSFCVQQINETHLPSSGMIVPTADAKITGKIAFTCFTLEHPQQFSYLSRLIITFQSFWIAAITQPVSVRVCVWASDCWERQSFMAGLGSFIPALHPVGAYSSSQISSVPVCHASIIKCGLLSVV